MEWIHRIPILTTLFSAWFFWILFKHWRKKPDARYLFWWTFGVAAYGAGTLTESLVALFGWNAVVFKSWYITGALLGGVPLAQGTVFLLMGKRFARISEVAVFVAIVVCSLLVILSPLDYAQVETNRLTGKVLGWQWVRALTPLINIYAFVFLVGGAAYSAWKYAKDALFKARFQGNVLIAVGGLLPGIGGSFTKFGYTEVLYVTELLGLLLIYWGYVTIRNDKSVSIHQAQAV